MGKKPRDYTGLTQETFLSKRKLYQRNIVNVILGLGLLVILLVAISVSVVPVNADTSASGTITAEIVPFNSITGNVREANGSAVSTANILFGNKTDPGINSTLTDDDGDYSILLGSAYNETYNVTASKAGYINETQNITVNETGPYFLLNFYNDAMLVPESPDMPYVLECINHWQYPPEEEAERIGMSKVLEVINVWII